MFFHRRRESLLTAGSCLIALRGPLKLSPPGAVRITDGRTGGRHSFTSFMRFYVAPGGRGDAGRSLAGKKLFRGFQAERVRLGGCGRGGGGCGGGAPSGGPVSAASRPPIPPAAHAGARSNLPTRDPARVWGARRSVANGSARGLTAGTERTFARARSTEDGRGLERAPGAPLPPSLPRMSVREGPGWPRLKAAGGSSASCPRRA